MLDKAEIRATLQNAIETIGDPGATVDACKDHPDRGWPFACGALESRLKLVRDSLLELIKELD